MGFLDITFELEKRVPFFTSNSFVQLAAVLNFVLILNEGSTISIFV